MLTEEPLENITVRDNAIAMHLPPFGIETFLMDVEARRP
jgi:hypothetical protein